ncbi:MAG: GNAT family N-acetyltransferase [Candidatus Zixiibacteriota bacterium]|nr:MAG: GNAT family N-acetyltransferase [candidate division Zixibacteria bacterium]
MNESTECRNLKPSDYDEIIRVWTEAGLGYKPKGRDNRDRMTVEISRAPDLFIGAFVNDKLIGTVFGSFDGRRGCVNRLAIVPQYRRQRIAEKLVAVCEERLKKMGALVIYCLIDKENDPSLTLFSKRLSYHIHDGIVYLSKRDNWDA